MPVLFITNNCPACNMTKKLLSNAGALENFIIYNVNDDPDGSIAKKTDELKEKYGLRGAPFVDPRDLDLKPFVGFNTDKIKEVIGRLEG